MGQLNVKYSLSPYTLNEHPLQQEMKFSIKYFFSKCDQIRRKLRIWSHLLKKCLMENFIFCALTFMKMQMSVLKMLVSFFTNNGGLLLIQ